MRKTKETQKKKERRMDTLREVKRKYTPIRTGCCEKRVKQEIKHKTEKKIKFQQKNWKMNKNPSAIKQKGKKITSACLSVREEKNLEDNPECQASN